MSLNEINQLQVEYRQQLDFHRQQAMVFEYLLHELESPGTIVNQDGDVVNHADFLDL